MKIIIVEDERVIRDGLEKLLLENEDVQVIAKCASAREGHQAILEKRPDVVITDIVMGSESGIDMIEWCRADGVKCEFVLVSGYSEFEYARRALQLNVFDYLNKPLDFSKMDNIIDRLREKLSGNKKIVDRSVDYFTGRMQPDSIEKPDILSDAELYIVAVNIYNIASFENETAFGSECCSQISQRHLKNYYRHIEKNGMHFMLVSGKEDLNSFISALLSHVKSMSFKLNLRIGISRRFDDISHINEGINEALAAVHSCAMNEKTIENAALLSYQITDKPENLFMREFLKIRDRLQVLDAKSVCDTAFEELDNLSQVLPPYAQFAFLRRCCREVSWSVQEDKGAHISDDIGDWINSAPTAQNLRDRFRIQVENLLSHVLNEGKNTDDVIEKAISYIGLHYAEPLRAADVAKVLYMDSVYFSKRFKKATGVNYNDYLTQLRMRKAERLLQLGNYSIAEVAAMVGYQSQRHFSKLFREFTGQYPSDIRKN